jgi:hypothetical protein
MAEWLQVFVELAPICIPDNSEETLLRIAA